MSPASKLSRAFEILLPSITQIVIHVWCYTCRDAPLVFNIWQPLCSLFVEHGCLLFFFKLTLASNVLLMQELSVSVIARFLQVGKTITKKKIQESTCTEIPPRLITLPGREKQDKWIVGVKRSKLEQLTNNHVE